LFSAEDMSLFKFSKLIFSKYYRNDIFTCSLIPGMSAKLARLLSDQRIPATQVPLQSFNHTKANCRCGNTQALNVIISGDIPADSSLRQVWQSCTPFHLYI